MKDVLIRETNISGMKVYVKSIKNQTIPMSLWEAIKESPEDLYDNISISSIKEQVNYNGIYLLNSFDCYSNLVINHNNTDLKTSIEIIITELNLNVSPEDVGNVCLFVEYVKNIRVVDKLKAYKTIELGKEVVKNRFLLGLWAERIKKGKVKALTEDIDAQSASIRIRTRFKSINSKFYIKEDSNPIVEVMINNYAVDIQKVANKFNLQVIARELQIVQYYFKSKQELTFKTKGAIRRTIPEMIIPETSFGKYRGNGKKINELYAKLDSISKDRNTKKPNNNKETEGFNKNYTQFIKRNVLTINSSKASRLAFTLNCSYSVAEKKFFIISEIGAMNIEFFPELLKGMCKLILDYREMYWFRDWSMISNNKSIMRTFNRAVKNSDVKINIIPSEFTLSLF
jgi:hypothetical protein